jgi:hypothetical protein
MAEKVTIGCLLCKKDFEWDETMFRFCDDCIARLEDDGTDVGGLEELLLRTRKVA